MALTEILQMRGFPQSFAQIARRTEISSRRVHGIISRQARLYFAVLTYKSISITVPKCAENDPCVKEVN